MQTHQFFAGHGLRQRLVKVYELRFVLVLHLEELGPLYPIQLHLRKIAYGRAGELKDDLNRFDGRVAIFALPVYVLFSDHVSDSADCSQKRVRANARRRGHLEYALLLLRLAERNIQFINAKFYPVEVCC